MAHDIEYDVTWEHSTKEYMILVDLGDDTVTLSRSELEDMLRLLDEAELK